MWLSGSVCVLCIVLCKHCLLFPWLHCVMQSLSITRWLRVCFHSPSFSQLHLSFSLTIAYWIWTPGMNTHMDVRSCDLSPEGIYFGVCLGSKLNIELIQTWSTVFMRACLAMSCQHKQIFLVPAENAGPSFVASSNLQLLSLKKHDASKNSA